MTRNDVRWVCQFQNGEKYVCNGNFRPSGYAGKRGSRCRLYTRCHGQDPQLETRFPQHEAQKQLKPKPDPARANAHRREWEAILHCFFPEVKREADVRRYRENPQKYRRYPAISEVWPSYVPLNAAKPPPPPPCGADCRNCPYDNCRYLGWNEDDDLCVTKEGWKRSRAKIREWGRGYRDRRKERLASDPVFAAQYKEKTRRHGQKAYAKKKFVKEGGDPVKFEALWAKVGGDPDEFKKMMKARKI